MIRAFVVAAFLGVAAGAAAIGAAPVALADPSYANCTDAHADGAYDIQRSPTPATTFTDGPRREE